MPSRGTKGLLAGLTPEMLLDVEQESKGIPFEPMEFFESDRYCGMNLYPMQRLLLKIINLCEDYTDRENQLIDQWTSTYRDRGYRVGIVSDVRERIRILRRNGYKAFNQIILILGRRASKTTLCGAQWALHDAQLLSEGIPRVSDTSKQDDVTYGIAMATTAQQAQESIFASYYRTVSNCPWFSKYIKRVTPFEITYQTLEDKLKTVDMIESGMNVEREPVSMVCRPISSNSDSIRGRPVVDFCLGEDSLVRMSDGSVMRIADLSVGDHVSAFKENDPSVPEDAEVLAVHHLRKPAKRIWFDDGTYIDATDEHRFVNGDGDWVEVRDMRPGDTIMEGGE